jgi:hypothetical protein
MLQGRIAYLPHSDLLETWAIALAFYLFGKWR